MSCILAGAVGGHSAHTSGKKKKKTKKKKKHEQRAVRCRAVRGTFPEPGRAPLSLSLSLALSLLLFLSLSLSSRFIRHDVAECPSDASVNHNGDQ
jgi:hypothetical protein